MFIQYANSLDLSNSAFSQLNKLANQGSKEKHQHQCEEFTVEYN